FLKYQPSVAHFDYVIAIQVFQHGADTDAAAYMAKVAALLRPGGLLFLRVNSVSTQIYHPHTVVERNALGGFTIRYDDGPKRGMLIPFYSDVELRERLTPAFAPVLEPHEDVIVRAAPKTRLVGAMGNDLDAPLTAAAAALWRAYVAHLPADHPHQTARVTAF